MEPQASSEWRVNTLDREAHVCFLYETEDQLLTVLASFIREGLKKNEKIICIADATSSETPLEGFCSESPDLGASLKTGQLTILKAEDVYLRSGVFDPAEMIALLKGYTEGALTEGYAGLRVTGAATWALRDLPGADRLIEYEARFNDFLPGSRCLALCQYPLKRFPASLLLDVLRTHPQIIIGTEVHDNPHYVPPSIFLGTDPVKGPNGEITGLVHIMRNITEHKRVEAALTEEKEFADAIIQSLPGAFYLLDETMRFLRWNTNFRRVMEHYSDEEVSSMSPLDFLRDEEKKKVAKAVRQAFQHGESSVEAHIVNKDGTSAPYFFSGRVFTLNDKRYLAGMGIDISQRKEMEKALRESEKRFRNLYDEAPVGYFEYDLQGNITQVNRTELEMLGYTVEEMIGQPCWNFIVEDARGQILEKLAGTRSPAHGLERTYRRKDGTTFPVLYEDRLLTDENGRITGIRTTIQDITERKRSEEALRERDNLLKKLSIHVPGMIYQFMRRPDGTYCVPFASEAVKDIFGCSPEDVKEDFSPIARAILPEDLDRLMESVKSSAEHMTVWRREYRVQLPGGPVRWIYGESSPEKLADGSIIWHGFNRDITERKQAEEEREKLNAQLIQAQKMESVGRLAGGVAHDFNNKLTVMMGYAQMAMNDLEKTDPLYGNLQEVLKAGKQSVDIVRQLLAFARKQIIAPEVLDLNETMEGMLKMLRRLIGEDIDLLWQPDTNLWNVKMDPSQIDQILANLCVNARDAIQGAGKVTIETRNTILNEAYRAEHAGAVPGEYVMLAVSDAGCGMDRETLENIFEPFFTTKDREKGTGLGLATVYGIVKQNNGFIGVESEPGRGTAFRIYLPRHGEEVEEKVEAVETETPQGRGETILIVEDDAPVLQLAQRVLENLGYAVLTSASPAEAITTAREYQGEIHLLMTDVVLPEMSGKELAGEISRIRPAIRTLYMSGYTADVIAHHGVLDEGVQFIGKPFMPDILARKVREALGSEK
ncbi:MAG: PAS domain S-box protein [Candidatus Desulfacyla sp.]